MRNRGRVGLPRRLTRGLTRQARLIIGLAAAVLAVVAGVFAARQRPAPRPAAPPAAAPAPDSTAAVDTLAFKQLRPRQGDHMAPPRIGFRWDFTPTDGVIEGVSFRVHLRGMEGGIEITRQTQETHLNVDLGPNYPLGECEWWVEAIRPGSAPIRSLTERFDLKP